MKPAYLNCHVTCREEREQHAKHNKPYDGKGVHFHTKLTLIHVLPANLYALFTSFFSKTLPERNLISTK